LLVRQDVRKRSALGFDQSAFFGDETTGFDGETDRRVGGSNQANDVAEFANEATRSRIEMHMDAVRIGRNGIVARR
jgi:hypothetical protein